MLGVGVMIGMLAGSGRGDKEANIVKSRLGKKIYDVKLVDEEIHIVFDDPTVKTLRLWDGGQSCCEYRYTTTDDDLSQFKGATLLDIEIREVPEDQLPKESQYDDTHEVQFLVLITNRGNITFQTHNVHNGYYGGFWIQIGEGD